MKKKLRLQLSFSKYLKLEKENSGTDKHSSMSFAKYFKSQNAVMEE